jgi:hypothetical protein
MYSVQDLLVQICHNDKCIKYLYLLHILLFPLLKLYEKEYYRYLVLQNIEDYIYNYLNNYFHPMNYRPIAKMVLLNYNENNQYN